MQKRFGLVRRQRADLRLELLAAAQERERARWYLYFCASTCGALARSASRADVAASKGTSSSL